MTKGQAVSAALLLATAGWAGGVACSSEDPVAPSRGCVANDTKSCDCPDGSTGSQTCEDDGESWSACECAETSSSDETGGGTTGECQPGKSQACLCDVGSSSQVCSADGTWGECQCASTAPASGGAPGAGGSPLPGAGGTPVLGAGGTPVLGAGGTPVLGAGGTPGAGGAPAATGGAPVATGGAPAATGGAPAATGGAPAATGGAPAATGGAPAATGGASSEGTPTGDSGIIPSDGGNFILDFAQSGIIGAWYTYTDTGGSTITPTYTSPSDATQPGSQNGEMCFSGTALGHADTNYGTHWGAGAGFDVCAFPADMGWLPADVQAMASPGETFSAASCPTTPLSGVNSITFTISGTWSEMRLNFKSSSSDSDVAPFVLIDAAGTHTISATDAAVPADWDVPNPGATGSPDVFAIQFQVASGSADAAFDFCVSNISIN